MPTFDPMKFIPDNFSFFNDGPSINNCGNYESLSSIFVRSRVRFSNAIADLSYVRRLYTLSLPSYIFEIVKFLIFWSWFGDSISF